MTKQVQDTMLKQLKNPFDPKFIKWRVGATNEKKESGRVITPATKGIALAYIDSREVKKRLDEVMGLDGWQTRYISMDSGFICELDLWINDKWVTKSNAADFTKISPIKGGASDALKRAAATWGIGHYLYYLPNKWVEVNDRKQLVNTPELPSWAKPGAVSNWEDVAELEADGTSGADDAEIFATAIDTLESISNATTVEDLDMRVEALTVDQQLLLANQIQIKRKALLHDAKINSDNS